MGYLAEEWVFVSKQGLPEALAEKSFGVAVKTI